MYRTTQVEAALDYVPATTTVPTQSRDDANSVQSKMLSYIIQYPLFIWERGSVGRVSTRATKGWEKEKGTLLLSSG